MNSRCSLSAIGLWVVVTCVTHAQEAHFINADVESRAVSGGLETTFHALVSAQEGTAWLGYAVPIVGGNFHIRYWPSEDRSLPAALRHYRCRLEEEQGREHGMDLKRDDEGDERERVEHLLVLYRIVDKKVGKIRVFTDDCELDAGGLKVVWLTGVNPKQSIELLARFVTGKEDNASTGRRLSEPAIAAIALHADSAADRALENFADAHGPEEVRKNTAFWLGDVRGQRGYEILRRMVHEESSPNVREQYVFALHISNVPEALNTMVEMARSDRSARVRRSALFWLSQKAGEKAAKAISDAVQNDPETEVKKQAVFALSRLPKDEGIPKLIHVARVNRNKEVRKDAIFWLGQSHDPRALDFFEEILTH